MTKRKLSKEEAAEVAARKRHKSINMQIRGARGTTVEVPIGVREENVAMGQFVRQSTGRGKPNEKDIMELRRAAAELNILLTEDGTAIKHDFRTDAEKAEQEAG